MSGVAIAHQPACAATSLSNIMFPACAVWYLRDHRGRWRIQLLGQGLQAAAQGHGQGERPHPLRQLQPGRKHLRLCSQLRLVPRLRRVQPYHCKALHPAALSQRPGGQESGATKRTPLIAYCSAPHTLPTSTCREGKGRVIERCRLLPLASSARTVRGMDSMRVTREFNARGLATRLVMSFVCHCHRPHSKLLHVLYHSVVWPSHGTVCWPPLMGDAGAGQLDMPDVGLCIITPGPHPRHVTEFVPALLLQAGLSGERLVCLCYPTCSNACLFRHIVGCQAWGYHTPYLQHSDQSACKSLLGCSLTLAVAFCARVWCML
jgi:hypothetical protein